MAEGRPGHDEEGLGSSQRDAPADLVPGLGGRRLLPRRLPGVERPLVGVQLQLQPLAAEGLGMEAGVRQQEQCSDVGLVRPGLHGARSF